MEPPKKKQRIHNPEKAIKKTAWNQVAKEGAASLSLRAIARKLRITAPAIYNYFPTRDDLVTALIVDAFASLGDAQRAAAAKHRGADAISRLRNLGFAYREWAKVYPQRYQLIFGTPIPGYIAPAQQTQPAATAALIPLMETIETLLARGNLRRKGLAPPTLELKSMLDAWSQFIKQSGVEMQAETLYLALVIWSRVHGLMLLELGNQMPVFITDPGEVFRREIESLISQYFQEEE